MVENKLNILFLVYMKTFNFEYKKILYAKNIIREFKITIEFQLIFNCLELLLLDYDKY